MAGAETSEVNNAMMNHGDEHIFPDKSRLQRKDTENDFHRAARIHSQTNCERRGALSIPPSRAPHLAPSRLSQAGHADYGSGKPEIESSKRSWCAIRCWQRKTAQTR